MFAKVKSSIFIDALQLEITSPNRDAVRAVLKDERGTVCRSIEKDLSPDRKELTWHGLNDLPYGKYTLELSQGEDEMKMNLVKRV